MSYHRLTTEQFIARSTLKHNSLYTYLRAIYVDSKEKILITCRIHGDFPQTAPTHLVGSGCPDCANTRRGVPKGTIKGTTLGFTTKAITVWGDLYDYSKVAYVGCFNEVTIICKEHGEFQRTPAEHLAKQGCTSCKSTRSRAYSFSSVEWIEQYAKSHRLKNVQHALNGGEYNIPGDKRMFVDGFHARSNTVFEFHGSCWHGDPNVYKPRSHPHPFKPNVTARQLYKETIAKEDLLVSLGYNVVVIWSSDYRTGKKLSYKL